MVDSNRVIHDYLVAMPAITALVGARVYAANPLPADATLPCISFFTRGGTSIPSVPQIVVPSVQFSCWADDPIEARKVYRALYDELNGLYDGQVTIDGTDYWIMRAIEEVQGQDIQDTDIPAYWKVLTFYAITIRNF